MQTRRPLDRRALTRETHHICVPTDPRATHPPTPTGATDADCSVACDDRARERIRSDSKSTACDACDMCATFPVSSTFPLQRPSVVASWRCRRRWRGGADRRGIPLCPLRTGLGFWSVTDAPVANNGQFLPLQIKCQKRKLDFSRTASPPPPPPPPMEQGATMHPRSSGGDQHNRHGLAPSPLPPSISLPPLRRGARKW